MTVTEPEVQVKLAEFITRLKYDQAPAEIIADVRYRLLDWVGSAMAGIKYQPAMIATDMVKVSGGAPEATLIGGGVKAPVALAAFANGITGHVAECDDGHRLAIAHPGAVTVPVGLALAECYRRSGKELLAAIIAGYEVLIRLGTAVNPSHYKMWHTTGTCGAFAATATAASLLRLDCRKTQMALGIVGTMAAGFLAKTAGTHAKPLNAGHACQSGVQAALLAMRGFTGPTEIIAGEKGFMQATSSAKDTTILSEIGAGNLLTKTAYYKVYASCGHTNAPLDALFSILHDNDLTAQTIKTIRVATYRVAVELTGRFQNNSEEGAKFSLPYCLAIALLHHRVTLEDFSPEQLRSRAVKTIADKVEVVEDPEASRLFPARRATIRIELESGEIIEKRVDGPNDVPRYNAIEEKFTSLARTSLDSQIVQRLKALILRVDDLADITELTDLLA